MILFQVSASNYANPSFAAAYNEKAKRAAQRMGLKNATIVFFWAFDQNALAFRVYNESGRAVAVRYHDQMDRRCFYGVFKA